LIEKDRKVASSQDELKYICSGGIDSTIIPVGTEAEAKKLVERVLMIVEKRSSGRRGTPSG
jgi:hypothetical protein